MNHKILIVDDENDICELIEMCLHSNGFKNTKIANDGKTALIIAEKWLPDLILLDVMLPIMSGKEVCKALKNNEITENIPIIMLTAKSSEHDIIEGLDIGANDYITKPFSNKILVARIKALLRTVKEFGMIKFRGIQIDLNKRIVTIDSKIINLTFSEFEILKTLTKYPERVYSRSELISIIRGEAGYDITERVIDFQIVNLRKKLGDYGSYIETVRGVGYKLRGEE